MSSILSTSACGVGTQTTSLPAWYSWGTYGLADCAIAWPCGGGERQADDGKAEDGLHGLHGGLLGGQMANGSGGR